jgi:hypothetical protein
VPDLGSVWQPDPDVVGPNFTPYATDGQWVASDDGVWTFQTKDDSQWAWAAYHYGRWTLNDDYGWVWVPGTQWAPAWVEWRFGGGYVGWVPAAPAGTTVVEARWTFVEERNFTQPAVLTFALPPERAHVAFDAAAPLVEVHGRARIFAGPSVSVLKTHGVTVKTIARFTPARGGMKVYAKARAQASAPRVAARAKVSARPVRTGGASGTAHAGSTTSSKPASEKPGSKPAAEKPGSKPAEKPASKPAAAEKPARKPAAEKPAPKPAPKKEEPKK